MIILDCTEKEEAKQEEKAAEPEAAAEPEKAKGKKRGPAKKAETEAPAEKASPAKKAKGDKKADAPAEGTARHRSCDLNKFAVLVQYRQRVTPSLLQPASLYLPMKAASHHTWKSPCIRKQLKGQFRSHRLSWPLTATR